MTRAERRRAAKAAASSPPAGTPERITLENPVANHFEAFIVGNAAFREERALALLAERYPDTAQSLADYAAAAEPADVDARFRTLCTTLGTDLVAHQGDAAGQHVVICGAGPSLAEHIAAYAPQADQLWGCNSALTYLLAQGYAPTHGFAIDQTPAMLGEWASAPDVEYLLASTVHPHLTEFLAERGRRLRFFHNWVGIPRPPVQREDGEAVAYEDWLYGALFPTTVRAGSGLNAVTRAVDVAMYMGATRISVLGADCALRVTRPLPPETVRGSAEHVRWLREETQMHADGGHALASGATPITFGGEIDGRHWTTKPDLVITAQTLRLMADAQPERIILVGDTLPNALAGKSAEFLARLPQLTDAKGETIKLL
jgi:hypothetical protein